MHITINSGEEHNYAIKLVFRTIKNKAEYEASLMGLSVAKALGVVKVEVRAYSQVVIN